MTGTRGGPPRRRDGAAERRARAFLAVAALAAGTLAFLLLWPWQGSAPGPAGGRPADAGPDGGDDEELPETLTRDQVRDALRSLAPYVGVCGEGEQGVLRVHLDVHGPTGQVKSATVAKQFAGSRVADCAVAVVEAAQFPRFRKKSLTVVFPFTFGRTRDGGAPEGGAARDAGDSTGSTRPAL